MKQNRRNVILCSGWLCLCALMSGLVFSCASTGGAGSSEAKATAAAGAVPSPSDSPSLQAVSVALASGDAGKAIAVYESFSQLDADRDSPEAKLLMGNLLLSDGQLDKAGLAFRAALTGLAGTDPIAAKSMSADAHYGLYLIARHRGDAGVANQEIDLALAANPEHGGVLCALAQIDLANKNYERAAERFDKSLRADPENLVAMQGKATVLARTDRVNEAINLLCEVLVKDPANPQALADRGKLYGEVNQWDAAIADLGSLIKYEPDNYLNYLDRGRILVRAGRGTEGLADFDKVLEMQPQATLAKVYRGQVFWQNGRFDEARRDMEAVLEAKPGYLPVIEPLALMAWKSGRFVESARYFEMEYDPRLKNYQVLAMAVAAQYLAGDKLALKTLVDRLHPLIAQDSPFYQAVSFLADPAQEGKSLEQLKTLKNQALLGQYKLLTAVPLLKMGRKQTGINILKDVIDSLPAESAEGRIATWMMDEYQR